MHRAGHVRSLWIISGVDSKLFVRVIRVTMTEQWARDRWFIVSSLTKPSDQILQNAKFQWFGWYWIHRVHRFPVNSINNSNKYVVEFVSRGSRTSCENSQVVKIAEAISEPNRKHDKGSRLSRLKKTRYYRETNLAQTSGLCSTRDQFLMPRTMNFIVKWISG